MKFFVTAPDRSTLGFSTYCCAGRHWSGGKATTIEVVDEDECPRIPHPTRQGVMMLNPVRLGRVAWKEVQEDPMLSKNAAPDDAELSLPPTNPAEQQKEETRQLRVKLSAVETKLATLEGSLNDRFEALHEAIAAALAKAASSPESVEKTPSPELTDDDPQEPSMAPAVSPDAEPSRATPIAQARSRRGRGG